MAIQLAQDYYKLLKIISEKPATLRQISLEEDDPKVLVNLNTRELELPVEYKDFLSIVEDHRAQNVYFIVDRFFEDVDLFNCTCVVEYVNANKQVRLYPITIKDMETYRESGQMILVWSVGNEATVAEGVLSFCLHFYSLNQEDNSYIYSLYTLPAESKIVHTLEYTSQQEDESNAYYTIQPDHYLALIDMIEKKNVYWIDV